MQTSKSINYLDLPVVGPYFGFFIMIWVYLRHYINLKIIFSMVPLPLPDLTRWLVSLLPAAIASNSTLSPYLQRIQQPIYPDWHSQFASVGPYQLNWDTQQYKCWISHFITFSLLFFLQIINLFWLFLILRIAWRYIMTGEERDDRSEPESEDEVTPAPEISAQAPKSEAPAMLLNGAPLAATGSSPAPEKPSGGTRTSPRKRAAKNK